MNNKNDGEAVTKSNTPLGYYKWFPRDFYTSLAVRSMSFTARAIYRELLDLQWENGCLTTVERMLNIIGVTVEQWREFEPFLDELFPGGVNKKLDDLRKQAILDQEQKSKAGKSSAQSRYKNNARSTGVQQAFNQTETETETETETNKERDIARENSDTEQKPNAEQIAEAVKKNYPSGDRAFDWRGFASWIVQQVPDEDHVKLPEAAARYAKVVEKNNNTGTNFVKSPKKWLTDPTNTYRDYLEDPPDVPEKTLGQNRAIAKRGEGGQHETMGAIFDRVIAPIIEGVQSA